MQIPNTVYAVKWGCFWEFTSILKLTLCLCWSRYKAFFVFIMYDFHVIFSETLRMVSLAAFCEWIHISCEMFGGGLVGDVVCSWRHVVTPSAVAEVVPHSSQYHSCCGLKCLDYRGMFSEVTCPREAEVNLMCCSGAELLSRTRCTCCHSWVALWHCAVLGCSGVLLHHVLK